jgi:hypothetical protein
MQRKADKVMLRQIVIGHFQLVFIAQSKFHFDLRAEVQHLKESKLSKAIKAGSIGLANSQMFKWPNHHLFHLIILNAG